MKSFNNVFRPLRVSVLLAGLSGVMEAGAQDLGLGLYPSYAGGIGVQAQMSVPQVYERYGLRFTAGVHLADAYDDRYDFGGFTLGDAKRDASLTEFGVNATLSGDVTYLFGQQHGWNMRVFAGPRLNGFLGMLDGRGMNMATTTAQIGMGSGVLFERQLARNLAFHAEVGADAYARGTFTHQQSGEATGYTPENYNISPGDPEYREFDRFVQQPTVLGKLKLGFALTF